MANIQYEGLAVTATSSGVITTYSDTTFTGFVEMIRYVASATTSDVIGNTASTILIQAERSGTDLISVATPATSATYYIRAATASTAGAGSTGSAQIPLYNERLLVTITSGSTDTTTKNGTIRFYVS